MATGEHDEKAECDEIEEQNQIVLQTIDARQRQGIVRTPETKKTADVKGLARTD